MKGLGDLVALMYADPANGLDSKSVEPNGRFGGLTHVTVDSADQVSVPAPLELARVEDPDDWVLSCIQYNFDTAPGLTVADAFDHALAALPRMLALPPAPEMEPEPELELAPGDRLSYPNALAVASAPVMPAAVAAAPKPLPLLAVDPQPVPAIDLDKLRPAVRHRAPLRLPSLRRVCTRAVNVLVTAVIVVLFLCQGAMGLLPFRASYILTGSMSPGMPVGSLVMTRKVPASQIHKGDVITFPDPDKPGVDVTHRVAAIEITDKGAAFLTKGDANTTLDAWRVPREGLIYRRVFSIAHVGFIFGWMHTPTTHLLVTLFPAFALATWILIWVWKPVVQANKAAKA